MKKRLWSILLVLCMVLSLLPATASAAKIVDSGKCGKNLTWTLDSNGLLTISGTGKMENYNNDPFGSDDSHAPWYKMRGDITAVIIRSGVTSIGDCAFSSTELTSVKIPDSVTNIGSGAFSNCTCLTNIKIPDSVKSIESSVFFDCQQLTSIKIPDSVKSIGSSAFQNCLQLPRIRIPNSVKSVGDSAFAECSSLTSVYVPDSVTSIGDEAFYGCSSLTSVRIPNSVSEIGYRTFSHCSKLTSIKIPDSVTFLGSEAFCWSGLVDVTIPNSVKETGGGVFAGCKDLKHITLSDRITSLDCVVYYGWGNRSGFFEDCTSLEKVDIPSSVTLIGEFAFKNCTGLTSVEIPDGVTSIGSYAFNNCTQLKTVTLPKTLDEVDTNAFDGTRIQDVYYNGTQKEWNNILIRTGNEPLFRATLHLGDETAPTTTPAAKTKFKDVKSDAYYADAVAWAVNHDPVVTAGTSATTFSPNNDCTRAQMVTFLWRAAGEPKPASTKNPFKDVKKGAYYYDAVLWAVGEGITAGTSENTFSPDDTVIRGQTVTFLWRMADQPTVKAKNPFKDVKSSAYYYDAVLWAVKNNITAGTSANAFSPNDSCTRAQIVTFLYRDLG